MNEITTLKEGFLKHLAQNKKSKKTIENYTRYLDRFLKVTQVEHVRAISPESVNMFRVWLKEQNVFSVETQRNETLSVKTQNYHLVALRVFLAYLKKCGHNTLLPKEVTLEQSLNIPLSVANEGDFWSMYQTITGVDGKSYRDRAILLLLGTTGVKVGELCALNRSAFQRTKLSVMGKVQRTVDLLPECVEALESYLLGRKDTDDALFVNNGKRSSSFRLTPRSVQRIVKQCAERASVEVRVTPQSFRNMYVAGLLSGETDATVLKEKVGYQHESTMEKYIGGIEECVGSTE